MIVSKVLLCWFDVYIFTKNFNFNIHKMQFGKGPSKYILKLNKRLLSYPNHNWFSAIIVFVQSLANLEYLFCFNMKGMCCLCLILWAGQQKIRWSNIKPWTDKQDINFNFYEFPSLIWTLCISDFNLWQTCYHFEK